MSSDASLLRETPPLANGEGLLPGRSGETPEDMAHRSFGSDSGRHGWRRLLVAALNLASLGGLIVLMTTILGHGGWTWPEIGTLVAFVITLPWLTIGFWNAVIGLVLRLICRDPARYLTPALARIDGTEPIRGKTALAMFVRHEEIGQVILRLDRMREELIESGWGDAFDIHILSDSQKPDAVMQEEAAVEAWRARLGPGPALHYRRRLENSGYKAGNMREFVDRCHADYDLFIPLDADSLMSARAILRLVRVMQASPEIGILQGLVVGRPAESFFTRAFQFGMRHGMRSYTAGSAWWHGDCGPFWGHNAAIRMAAFRDHCHLPVLPGTPPLGGHILSHDQVEAVLIRRGGYEVRVIAEEDESWEENPPALPEFIKRDLRWCQGNMQYFPLLFLPKLKAMSRMQLWLAIQMYLGGPAWMLFLIFGTIQAFMPFPETGEPFPATLGLILFGIVMTMAFMPKIVGLVDILLSRRLRKRYGGGGKLLVNAGAEFTLSALIAPVVGLAQSLFVFGLIFGRKIAWDSQKRDGYRLSLKEAARGLWPQTLFGLAMAGALTYAMPQVLPWAAPVLIALILAAPVASLTAAPWLGRFSRRIGLCAIPEDRDPPKTLTEVGDWAPLPQRGDRQPPLRVAEGQVRTSASA